MRRKWEQGIDQLAGHLAELPVRPLLDRLGQSVSGMATIPLPCDRFTPSACPELLFEASGVCHELLESAGVRCLPIGNCFFGNIGQAAESNARPCPT